MSHELHSAGGPRGAALQFCFHSTSFIIFINRNRASHGAGVGRTATEESPERGPATSSAVSIAYCQKERNPNRRVRLAYALVRRFRARLRSVTP
jgi:tryptophan 2,3-dioxygenase